MGQFTSNMAPIENSLGDADVETTHYWVYAPGKGASMWEDFYSQGVMGLAWHELGDLSAYASKEEIRLTLVDPRRGTTNPSNDAYGLWQFVNDLKPGDVVFAKGAEGRSSGAASSPETTNTTRPRATSPTSAALSGRTRESGQLIAFSR